jgi:hypothetical protein
MGARLTFRMNAHIDTWMRRRRRRRGRRGSKRLNVGRVLVLNHPLPGLVLAMSSQSPSC